MQDEKEANVTDSLPLWYGIYGDAYAQDEPAFFDAKDFAWAQQLKAIYPALKEQLQPLMSSHEAGFLPYFDPSIQFPPNNWKTISFMAWGKPDYASLERFPEVERLLSQVPGLVSASLSLLEPGSRILPHTGETNAVFRVHLGMNIPAGLPLCGFQVKEETRAWQNGELLIFLDAYRHAAFNESGQRRYVLILDIMRAEFQHRTYRVCTHVLGILTAYVVVGLLVKMLGLNSGGQDKGFPVWFKWLVVTAFQSVWMIYLPIHKRLRLKRLFGVLKR